MGRAGRQSAGSGALRESPYEQFTSGSKGIYETLIEDYDSGHYYDIVETWQDSPNPLCRAEAEYSRRNAIECMLREAYEEDLSDNVRNELERCKHELQAEGLPSGQLSALETFQLARFWHAWQVDPSTRSGRSLREGHDPLAIMKRALEQENMEEIAAWSVFLEASSAGEHSRHYRQIDDMMGELEVEAREGATLEGRAPSGPLLLLPSSRWTPSKENVHYVSDGSVGMLSFAGRSRSFLGRDISVIAAEDIKEYLLGDSEEDVYDESTGSIREDIDLPEEELRTEVMRVAQHELLHDAQENYSEDELRSMSEESAGESMSLTEALTEELNLRRLRSRGWSPEEGAYQAQMKALRDALGRIQPDNEENLLEHLNALPRKRSAQLLDNLLLEGGHPSFRDILKEHGALLRLAPV